MTRTIERSKRCRPCWIKPCGEIILCPNWNDHLHEAAKEFPDASQPEGEAMCNGWLKMTGPSGGFLCAGKAFTHRQRKTLADVFLLDSDEIEEEAMSNLRRLVRNGRYEA